MQGPPPDSERCGITGEQIKMGGLFPGTQLTTANHSALTQLPRGTAEDKKNRQQASHSRLNQVQELQVRMLRVEDSRLG